MNPDHKCHEDMSLGLIALFKGLVTRESEPKIWQGIQIHQIAIMDYVRVLGLELVLDPAEGFAWLRSREYTDGETPLPRLMARRQLPYLSSLVLALLCRKLAESDAGGDMGKLVLSRDEMVEMVRVFLPESANETRLADQVSSALGKIEELGFICRLKSDSLRWEVRRVIRTFVDAQWLNEFSQRLESYRLLPLRGKGSPDTSEEAQ